MDGLLLLGPIEVRVGGRSVGLGGAKRQTLLAVLASSRNRRVANGALVEAVWPDGGESALSALRTEVSRLRSALNGVADIVADSGGYRLSVEADRCDVDVFERSVQAAQHAGPEQGAAILDSCLGLWRGEPLGGVGADLDVLRGWREYLLEMYRGGVETQAEAALSTGRHSSGVIGRLERFVAVYPERERGWALLMRALYLDGRMAESLRAYQRARSALGEMGLEPGEQLRETERRVAARDLDAATPTPHKRVAPAPQRWPVSPGLPKPATELVGRTADLDRLSSMLEGSRLISILAPAGMGKTRLAIEAAHLFGDRFEAGVSFCDLSTLNEVDTASVAELVLTSMSLAPRPGLTSAERIAEAIQRLHLLVILDNCEHVVQPVRTLLSWLGSTAITSTVLTTSRIRLDLEAETILALEPLSLSDAADLYRMRSQAATGYRPRRDAEPAIMTLVDQLDRMPLAIELAAARSGALDALELSSRLHAGIDLLTRSTRGARHSGLREALEWSTSLLDDFEKRLFQDLAAFADSFDLRAAELLCSGHTGWTSTQLADLFAQLFDASLVVRSSSWPGRFRLLETFRQHVTNSFSTGEATTLVQRHTHYVLAETTAIQRCISSEGDDAASQRLSQVWADLRVAQTRAAPNEASVMLLGLGLEGMFRERFELGPFYDALLDTEAADALADDIRSDLLANASLQDWIRGDFARGRKRWAEARHLQEIHGLPMTGSLGMAGGCLLSMHAEWDQAERDLRRSVELLRRQRDEFGELHVFIGPFLGHLIHIGRPIEALEALDRVQPRIDALDDPFLNAHATFRRSFALMEISPADAIGACREALEAADRARTPWTTGAVRNYLAMANLALGDVRQCASALAAQLDAVRMGASAQSLANTLRVAIRLFQQLDMNQAALVAQRWLAAQPAAAPGTPALRAVHEQRAEFAPEHDSASWTADKVTTWVLQQLSVSDVWMPV